MANWSPRVGPKTAAVAGAPAAVSAVALNSISDTEWEYRLRALNRQDRFERAEDTHSKRLWCLMLTLMILCGAAVLVAVVVAAFIFMSQNQK